MSAPVPPFMQAAFAGWAIGQRITQLKPLEAGLFLTAASLPLLIRKKWWHAALGAAVTGASLAAERLIDSRTDIVLEPYEDAPSPASLN